MGKLYELSVWYEPDGLVCAVCGKKKKHGVGIEGKKVDVDVCDDCAAGAVLASVETNQTLDRIKKEKRDCQAKMKKAGGKR